jgi:hypothetical protein
MSDVLVDQAADPDSEAAFKVALRKGTGRAMLILRSAPDSEALRAELTNACLYKLVHDQQCEISRTPYLVRLVQEIGQGRAVWNALVQALSLTGRENDQRDRLQMFEISCLLASGDASLDRTELERILVASDFHDFAIYLMEEFVGLQGIVGIIFCLRNFRWALEKDEFNSGRAFGSLKMTLIERDGLKAATQELEQACVDHPDLHQTLQQLYFKPETARQEFRPASREEVAARVLKKEWIPFHWIKAASEDDLSWAADQLLAADTDWETQQYLRVFFRHPFPKPVQRLFRLVRSGNIRVENGAMTVLGQVCDPAVRELAFSFLSGHEPPTKFVRLLRSNFQAGDFATIMPLLIAAAREHEYHSFGFHLLKLIDAIPEAPEESRSALLHLYEHGPCANCRADAVRHLAALGGIPRTITEEWIFDCEPDIAKFGAAAAGGGLTLMTTS